MKRQQRSLATRELILDCAEMEFFRAGTSQTTLEDIAAASGFTRGAIYGHFANKYEILSALFERSALPLDPFTISDVESSGPILEALRGGLFVCMRDVLVDGRKRRLYGIAHSLAITEAECRGYRDTVRRGADLARLLIRRALDGAVGEGEVRLDDDSEFVAPYIHASLTGHFLISLLRRPPVNPDDLATKIVDSALSPVGMRVPSAPR